jgi:4-hydroxy-2-oxoheptanedioate aldolase
MSVRAMWAAGESTLGAWLQTATQQVAEVVARHGFDYVCVDLQHGVSDIAAAGALIASIELGGGVPLARVPWNEPGVIGKVLDAGAHGVVVPMVNTAEQAAACVEASRYPPAGSRSWGPTLAAPRHNIEPGGYQEWAEANVAVIPMIETAEALANLDAILATSGVDAIYVGPADLSLALGLPPGNNDGTAEFDEALATIVAACERHRVVPGIHASGALAQRRLAQGFRMVTIVSDLVALRAGLAAEAAAAQSTPETAGPSSVY